MTRAIKSDPPARRSGRGGGRPISEELVNAMRVVANHPDEWFQVAEYRSAGSASSAASRMRSRDWNEVLGIDEPTSLYAWRIVSRSYDDREGAGVWARSSRDRVGG